MTDWTDDIDDVLNSIRLNCILLSKAHKKRYFDLKYSLNFYKLPVIVLNGCNSIISVGLQPYATQGTISLTTSLIALTCGIIGSIELFLGIQKRLENDLISQRDYYLLSVDIFKTLTLEKDNRPIPAKDYLEKSYNNYTKLIESSEALTKRIDDQLLTICIKKNCNDEIVITPRPNGHFDLSRNIMDLPHRGVELSIDDDND
jgi:hypothetical protein